MKSIPNSIIMNKSTLIEELINNPPFELSETDQAVLRTADDAFILHTWEGMKDIIAAGDMSLLRRTPSDLFNYIMWTLEMRNNGSVLDFIIKNRLPWKPTPSESGITFSFSDPRPFMNTSDFCIRRNDWPYAMGKGMIHLVAWSKTPIATDDQGDPSPESCIYINSFIERVFAQHICQGDHAGDNVQWFRNRTKWQSVRSLDHIHLILRDADEMFVTGITGQGPDDITCQTYKISGGT